MYFLRAVRGSAYIAVVLAVSILVGACGTQPTETQPASPIWSVELSPMEDTNPTKTQHTFIATVRDQDGRPVPNVQVHWILARTGDAVGDIVAYDDQDLGEGTSKPLTRKTDNQYAVSYTNDQPVVIDRGNSWVADEAAWRDFEVGAGQAWCTITSPVEGDSHMIAFVPEIKDGLRHKVFAIKHWQKVPHLVVEKQCPEGALIGEEFTYSITVMNDGDGETPGDVIVDDMLPEGIVIVDGTEFPSNFGRMGPGASNTIEFRVKAESAGAKVNRVVAQAGEFVARNECTTIVSGYAIDIVKDCTGTYTLGDVVTFNIRVTNTEDATLSNVEMVDALPAGVEYVDAKATAGEVAVNDGRNIVWSIPEMPGKSYADLSITARATELGPISNAAAVKGTVAGTEIEVAAEDSCDVEILGLAKLMIEKTCDPAQVGIGDLVTVTITVWNEGAVDATGVTVTDVVVEGLEAIGETSWYIDALPPSDKAGGRALTLQARATRAGTFTNVGTAIMEGMEKEVRDSCDITVVAPQLTIRKECKANDPVVGDMTIVNRMERATHMITVKNGEVTSQDVVVVDNIPLDPGGDERLKYLSSNPEGVYDRASHTVTWNLGAMKPGEETVVEVTFEARDIGPAINTATVTARGFAGAQDECRLFILGSPAFQSACLDALDGDPAADNFIVGSEFYYLLAVQNEGDADLKLDVTFSLTSELALGSEPVGFVDSITSRAVPSGDQVMSVNDLGGGKYAVQSFNLAPREQRWLRIPVKGVKVTATNAAKISCEINWQLWYDGQLFPKKGQSVEEETTVIDPE